MEGGCCATPHFGGYGGFNSPWQTLDKKKPRMVKRSEASCICRVCELLTKGISDEALAECLGDGFGLGTYL